MERPIRVMTPSLVKWTLEKIASLLLFTSTKCADLILMKRLSCAAEQGPRKLRIDRGHTKLSSQTKEKVSVVAFYCFLQWLSLSVKVKKQPSKMYIFFGRRMRKKNYFSTRCPRAKPLLIIVLNDCILFLCVVMNWWIACLGEGFHLVQ